MTAQPKKTRLVGGGVKARILASDRGPVLSEMARIVRDGALRKGKRIEPIRVFSLAQVQL